MARGKIKIHIREYWRAFFNDDVDPSSIRELNPFASNFINNFFVVHNLKLSRLTRSDRGILCRMINIDGSKMEPSIFQLFESRRKTKLGQTSRDIRFTKVKGQGFSDISLKDWRELQLLKENDLILFALSRPKNGQQHILIRPIHRATYRTEGSFA